MGNNVGLHQSNSEIEHRFQNRGQILRNLRSARQSKLALKTPSKLSFSPLILLEFYVQKPARTMSKLAITDSSQL